MKIKSLVIASALVGGLLSSASAVTITTLDPMKVVAPGKFEAPAPVGGVTSVQIPSSHVGSDVTLRMTIDENGRPRNVRVAGTHDQAAYKRLVRAVAKWQFSPARRDGQAVSARVELPLEVTGL